jgi:hypothetical protein
MNMAAHTHDTHPQYNPHEHGINWNIKLPKRLKKVHAEYLAYSTHGDPTYSHEIAAQVAAAAVYLAHSQADRDEYERIFLGVVD